jgi:hypothetical protein
MMLTKSQEAELTALMDKFSSEAELPAEQPIQEVELSPLARSLYDEVSKRTDTEIDNFTRERSRQHDSHEGATLTKGAVQALARYPVIFARRATEYATLYTDKRIEEVASKGAKIYRGVFKSGRTYDAGSFCSYGGHLFAAEIETAEPPGGASSGWKMIISKANDGAMGPMPEHKWQGTKLAFENPDGTFDDPVDLQGPPGKGSQQALIGGGTGGFDFNFFSYQPAGFM